MVFFAVEGGTISSEPLQAFPSASQGPSHQPFQEPGQEPEQEPQPEPGQEPELPEPSYNQLRKLRAA
jgi:hypothetical protein